MDASIRKQLTQLRDISQATGNSEVPEWLREKLVQNAAKLLDDNASNRQVADKLAGGLRAIMDASSPSDDDPIVSRIISIVDEADSNGEKTGKV